MLALVTHTQTHGESGAYKWPCNNDNATRIMLGNGLGFVGCWPDEKCIPRDDSLIACIGCARRSKFANVCKWTCSLCLLSTCGSLGELSCKLLQWTIIIHYLMVLTVQCFQILVVDHTWNNFVSVKKVLQSKRVNITIDIQWILSTNWRGSPEW